jgi:hypothetical protein
VIHFTNGDSVRDTLLEAGIGGDVVVCADVLHEGPCRADLSPTAFDDIRAQYLAERGYAPLGDIRSAFARRARAVERATREDEVVLWFEHDLFDQLNLIWLLDRFRQVGVPPERVTQIVIGEFPGVVPFHGLGQLTAAQLKGLFPTRAPLRPEEPDLGSSLWSAVCAPTPEPMAMVTLGRDRGWQILPFVPAAFFRLLEELPGHLDGLSRTERQGLAAIATGASTLEEAFQTQALQEAAIFLGDLPFFRVMQGLADAEVPLLTIEGNRVALTAEGVLVLAGDADFAALNGLDRWVGGTHLTGKTPRWRWNPERGVIVHGPSQ